MCILYTAVGTGQVSLYICVESVQDFKIQSTKVGQAEHRDGNMNMTHRRGINDDIRTLCVWVIVIFLGLFSVRIPSMPQRPTGWNKQHWRPTTRFFPTAHGPYVCHTNTGLMRPICRLWSAAYSLEHRRQSLSPNTLSLTGT